MYPDPKPTITDDKLVYIWQIQNIGGPVHHLLVRTILMGVDLDTHSRPEPNQELLVIRNNTLPSLGKEGLSSRLSTNSKESIAWINEAMKSDNRALLLAMKVSYEVPEELSLDGKPKRDSREDAFIWSKAGERFEILGATEHEIILNYINQKSLWNFEVSIITLIPPPAVAA
jgi:hypothetical protein